MVGIGIVACRLPRSAAKHAGQLFRVEQLPWAQQWCLEKPVPNSEMQHPTAKIQNTQVATWPSQFHYWRPEPVPNMKAQPPTAKIQNTQLPPGLGSFSGTWSLFQTLKHNVQQLRFKTQLPPGLRSVTGTQSLLQTVKCNIQQWRFKTYKFCSGPWRSLFPRVKSTWNA